jgi:WD40 repeat protein
MSLSEWLAEVGLGQYEQTFVDQGFERVEDLHELKEEHLEKLGLKMGHRLKLLRALRAEPDGTEPSKPVGHPPAAPSTDIGIETPPAGPSSSSVPDADILSAEPERRQKLFISYGRDGFADEARALKNALDRRGHDAWLDERRLQEGYDWQLDIEEGIRNCDWVILLMTPHSVRRPDGFCLKEITKAAELNKPIVPVLITDVPGGAPLLICNVQYLDWREAVPSRERAERFQQFMSRLCDAVENRRLDFEGGQRVRLKALQPLDYTRDTVQRARGFHGREWLKEQVERWIEIPKSRVFWLTGLPGVGKSAFAAHLCQTHPDVKARHFCEHGHQDRGDPRRALLSIVYQLAEQIPEYGSRLLEEDLAAESGKDVRTIFDNLLVRKLDGLDQLKRPVLVVIDAIDEASQGGRNAIAEMIRDYWAFTPGWLRLLITSRPESEVISTLAAFNPTFLDTRGKENREDMRGYLQRELSAIEQSVSSVAVEGFLDRSGGVFLYLIVVTEELREGRLSLDRLHEFPDGLAGYYSRFFQRQFPDIERFEVIAHAALQMILAAREPLSIENLREANGWSQTEFNRFKRAVGSLIEVTTESGTGVVRVFHKSLAEWLADEGRAGPYYVSEADGHRRLARAGLAEVAADVHEVKPYFLRHLPIHLRAAGMFKERRLVLTNFALAMRRCEAGALEEFLADYRGERGLDLNESLAAWAECIVRQAHLLRRGTEDWPAHRILLQVASEEADESAITQAAEAWVAAGHCDWAWMKRTDRPACASFSASLRVIELWTASVGKTRSVRFDGNEYSVPLQTDQQRTLELVANEDQLRIFAGKDELAVHSRLYNRNPDAPVSGLDGSADEARTTSHNSPGKAMDANWPRMLAASGHSDGWVNVVSLESGVTSRLRPAEELGSCTCLAFSPDGNRLAVGHLRGAICVYDLVSKQLHHRIDGHRVRTRRMAWLPDDRLLIGAEDGTLRVIDIVDGSEAALAAHSAAIRGIAVSRDGAGAVSIAEDGSVRTWALPDLSAQRVLREADGRRGLSVALSDDATCCSAGFGDGTLVVWTGLGTPGEKVQEIPGAHHGSIYGVALSSDGLRMVSGAQDTFVHTWSVATGECTGRLVGHAFHVTGLKVDPAGRQAVSAGLDNKLIHWDLERATQGRPSRSLGSEVTALLAAGSPGDDGVVAVGHSDGTLRLLSMQSLTLLPEASWVIHRGHRVWQLAQVPGSSLVVSAGWDGFIRITDTRSGSTVAQWSEDSSRLKARASSARYCVAVVSPDGRWLVISAGRGATLRVHDLRVDSGTLLTPGAGRLLRSESTEGATPKDAHAACIRAVAFEADGTHIRAADESGEIRRWNLLTLEEDVSARMDHYAACKERGLAVNRGRAAAHVLALLPKTGLLACGGVSRSITLWSLSTAKCVGALHGHSGGVNFLAAMEDGLQLASAGWDNTLRVWDISTYRSVLVHHTDRMSRALSVDGGQKVLIGTTIGEVFSIEQNRFTHQLAS